MILPACKPSLNGCQRIAIEARFLSYVVRSPTGCMIWVGGRSKGGRGKAKRAARGGPYGSFNIGKEYGIRRAHVVWAWLDGRLPEPSVPAGQQLDHYCDGSTLCVSCTNLIPKSLNQAYAKTRPACPAKRAEAIALADSARRKMLRRKRRPATKQVTRKEKKHV